MENVLRALIFNGQVSLTLADTTEIVSEGIRLHDLSETSAAAFGKALSAMTYMSACLKNEGGEISLSLKSDGECGEIAVSGNQRLALRGYIANTQAIGDGEDAVRACVGANGAITIIRDDRYRMPFVGSCALPASGELDEAFEEYYRISEQLPTRLRTVVRFEEDGRCAFAAVAVLQPLPFADEAALQKTQEYNLEELLAAIETQGVKGAAESRFAQDMTAVETREAVYKCNCSRAYLAEVLTSLGEAQMREIIREDGAVRVHCHYCNTDYEFTDADADEIFAKKA